jgi:ComF family protein
MLDILTNIFDTIFPKTAEHKILATETVEDFVRHFSPERCLGGYALASYDNAVIKAAITTNKFHDHNDAARLLATLVNHWHGTLPLVDTIYVPMPLSPKRESSRGYNQVARVLDFSSVSISNSLLIRNRDTKPQTSLPRHLRFSNMHGAFSVNVPKKFPYSRVVLVDDVITTGATMRAAQEALEAALPPHCQIICLALAH